MTSLPLALALPFLPFLAAACSDGKGDLETWPFDISLSTSEVIPTVIEVDWSGEPDGMESAWVEFGTDTTYGHRTTVDLSSDGPWRTPALGMKPDTEVHLRVVAETADGLYGSDDATITTGSAPTELPSFELDHTGDHWDGYLVTDVTMAPPALVILDPDADYVWWYLLDSLGAGPGGGPAGAGSDMAGRVVMSLDRQSILYNRTNVEGLQDSAIHRVSLDGTLDETLAGEYSHHDFVELPDGTIAFLAYDPRIVDGESLMGDRVMELSLDGTLKEIWNVWDNYSYSGSGIAPGGSWPHANAIDYVEEDDAYLVSMLTLGGIAKIDREKGDTLWTLGGVESDFTLVGGDKFFDDQHQMQWLGDGILTFVNGGMDMDSEARAIEYALDEERFIGEERWSYWPDPSITCTNLGDVHRFDNGNTLVTFSFAGEIQEVDPQGDVVWDLWSGASGTLGYVTWMSDLDVGAPLAD